MPLLGRAAMLLSFDIVPEAIAEHDDWHTHEHLPERLAIPGFIRGTRWTALAGGPRYFVIYEVAELGTLTSDAYLQRLNNPSKWTSTLMPCYRGMTRGFCVVTGSFGFGLGHIARLIRFKPNVESEARLRGWLLQDVLPALASKPGVGSTHLFERALAAPMTNEQQIRGADAGFDWAVFVVGYSDEALARITRDHLDRAGFEQHGALGVVDATYRVDYSLSRDELMVR